jgi:hypothetical protein
MSWQKQKKAMLKRNILYNNNTILEMCQHPDYAEKAIVIYHLRRGTN